MNESSSYLYNYTKDHSLLYSLLYIVNAQGACSMSFIIRRGLSFFINSVREDTHKRNVVLVNGRTTKRGGGVKPPELLRNFYFFMI